MDHTSLNTTIAITALLYFINLAQILNFRQRPSTKTADISSDSKSIDTGYIKLADYNSPLFNQTPLQNYGISLRGTNYFLNLRGGVDDQQSLVSCENTQKQSSTNAQPKSIQTPSMDQIKKHFKNPFVKRNKNTAYSCYWSSYAVEFKTLLP